MNLTSELPYWTVRNGLLNVYPAADRDIRCDALVIGGGISGALLARRLTSKGVDCVVIDRRDIGFGSTSASTALLQYEIDTPLRELRDKVGSKAAERAYRAGLEAIERLAKMAGRDCDFAMRPSLQVAARRSHLAGLRQEYELRRKLGFPVAWLTRQDLRESGIHADGALRSRIAAEVDPYRLTHRLLRLAVAKGLRVLDRTTAIGYSHTRKHVSVTTDRNCVIRCRTVFFATGYETQEILPEKIVTLRSTYAFISEPVPESWKDRSPIWGTGDPYVYMRTSAHNRILVGGEDDHVLDPARRDRQIEDKTQRLVRRFNALFPHIKIEPAFAWAGMFGSTKDGLAWIGPHEAFPRAYFALGFGGNGITFAEIASRILTDLFLGRKNPDAAVFSFDR
jgi:glycine/D-amino acid oxidase-like deaminating enzyme